MAYTANHKWYDELGNVVPNVEYSPSERPHGEFQVAPWIAVGDGVYDKAVDEWHAIMPGKSVCLTRDGYVVPAGLRRKITALAAAATCWSYGTEDTANRVTDILTGTYATATGAVTKSALAARLHTLGYIDTAAGEDADSFFSCPVGVAPYPYYQNAGGDGNDPSLLRQHNHQLQQKVAILTDYVVQLPWVPGTAAAVAFTSAGTLAGTSTHATDVLYITMTANTPIAAPTPRSSWAFSGAGTRFFINKKDRVRDVRTAGDYNVDEDANTVYFQATHGTAFCNTSLGTVVYYHYNHTADPTGIGNYACVVGDIQPGMYLIPTSKSNYKPATKANCFFTFGTNGTFIATNISTGFSESDATDLRQDMVKITTNLEDIKTAIVENADIIGQVLRVFEHPRGSLDKVRTAWTQASWTARYQDRMPGSATEGLPDLLTYAGGANKTVLVNIIRR